MINYDNIIVAELMEAYGDEWQALQDWLAYEEDMQTNPWG